MFREVEKHNLLRCTAKTIPTIQEFDLYSEREDAVKSSSSSLAVNKYNNSNSKYTCCIPFRRRRGRGIDKECKVLFPLVCTLSATTTATTNMCVWARPHSLETKKGST